jgi:hypothetical protein
MTTFGDMKTHVAANLNNLATSDPQYANLGSAINEAANAVLMTALARDRRNANNFPELRRRRWSDVTVNEQGYLDKPTNCLVIDSVKITKSTAAYNQSRSTEYPVTEEQDWDRFALLSKASTTVGYPTIWTESGTQILLHPTPTTAFLTRVVVRGMREEDTLTTDGQSYQMDSRWHPVIELKATHLMALRMGLDGAKAWDDECDKRLTMTLNLLGLGNRLNRTIVEVAGRP